MNPERVKLSYPEALVSEPLIGRMVLEFGVLANIRRANVEEHFGWLVCELSGDPERIDAALRWLVEQGVQVDRLSDFVEG